MGQCCRYASNGLQCHPLIVVIDYDYGIEFTCIAYDVTHNLNGPYAAYTKCENSRYVRRNEVIRGNRKTDTYWFALQSVEEAPCKQESPVEAKVVFRITPPLRGFHGSPQKYLPPFSIYDSSNPAVSMSIRARRGDESDYDRVVFAVANNDDMEEHLNHPSEQIYDLIVTLSGDSVEITRQRV